LHDVRCVSHTGGVVLIPRKGEIVARSRILRSQLYREARILGNAQAASKGPLAYGRRYARRKVYTKSNSLTRTLLRSLGLSH
jgi:hypothetical protein